MFKCHHCMMCCNAEMVAVLYTYPPGSYLFCLFNGYLHCKRCHYKSETTITIYYSSGWCFMNDFYGRCSIYAFCLPKANVPTKTSNSMRVDPAKIGGQQCFCGRGSILFAATDFLKHLFCKFK